MKRRIEKILLLVAVSLGVLGLFTLSGFYYISVLIYGFGLFFGVGFILSSFYLGRKAFKLGILLLIPIVTFYILNVCLSNYRRNKAKDLITKLEIYYSKEGFFPKENDSLFNNTKSWLRYSSTTNQKDFSISYSIDGINRCYYDCSRDTWYTIGWN